MKKWQFVMGTSLIALSAAIYGLEFLIFHDAQHIFTYLIGDIAFIPIEVLFVTIIIHQLLEIRAKNERMEKMNMVIGVFFSEVGTGLMTEFSKLDRQKDALAEKLVFTSDWSASRFDDAFYYLQGHGYEVSVTSPAIENIRTSLAPKRDFLLRLLENPNLLEHESFTKLLMAVFHLIDELNMRKTLNDLPATDYEHIAIDIKRAYSLLTGEWIRYMEHLRANYPFLYSLAMRTNPFDPRASVIVRK